MNRSVHKRLLRTALFSTPIIALYGATPLYIFGRIPLNVILFAGTGLLVNIFIFWLVNIWLIRKTWQHAKPWRRYALSHSITLGFHIVFSLARFLFINTPDDKLREQLPLRDGGLLLYPFMSVLAINTIIIIISNSILLSHKKKSAELEVESLKVNNLEAQQKVLMQQLQPHFLFNALSVLKSLIKENADEAERYTVKLSAFLRYAVQVNNTVLVPLADELAFTQDYIELQKVRFGDSLQVDIDVPGEVRHQQLPAYALQTLVENAIKHNAFTEKRPLHIHIWYQKGVITIRNNKLLAKLTGSPGTGLKNLNDRYQLIANESIAIIDGADSFEVTVKLLHKEQRA
jgi:two-component system, LytTR family, sensor kinase